MPRGDGLQEEGTEGQEGLGIGNLVHRSEDGEVGDEEQVIKELTDDKVS
jgi:hypothetical protein